MLGLIQLVSQANVKIDHQIVATIDRGIMALIGIEKSDTEQYAEKLLEKIINYRIFPDSDGKMNLSLKQIEGALLLVPQFTLVAETDKGTRPGFSRGMPPEEGARLFHYLLKHARSNYSNPISAGEFGAHMEVSLCNDGPVTFLLKTKT